jgi:hypothetical protein
MSSGDGPHNQPVKASSGDVVDLDAVGKELKDIIADSKKDSTGYLKEIEIGDFVDIYDSTKVWRLSKVLSKEEKFITVKIIGWPEKFKETVPLLTQRIRPMRTESSFDSSHFEGQHSRNSPNAIKEMMTVNIY